MRIEVLAGRCKLAAQVLRLLASIRIKRKPLRIKEAHRLKILVNE
jgi:hypothetical protein